MTPFRVGLSAGFLQPDGSPAYLDFDLAPLMRDPGIELVKLRNEGDIAARDVAELDALILLGEGFRRDSIDPGDRLALVARFGVGYDTVDVDGLHRERGRGDDHAGRRAPAGRGVGDRVPARAHRTHVRQGPADARAAPPASRERSAYMGIGLVGRTFGLVGLGNIGAETVRLAQPFGMTIVAHDPYADPARRARARRHLVELDELFGISDFISLHCPLTPQTRHLVDARAARVDEAECLPDQHGARADRRSGARSRPRCASAASPAPASTCSIRSRRPRTIRCSCSTMSSWRRTRSAIPINASPASGHRAWRRRSQCARAACRRRWSIRR